MYIRSDVHKVDIAGALRKDITIAYGFLVGATLADLAGYLGFDNK